MYQREIYAEAIARIEKRRVDARVTQERHSDEIRTKIPESVELENQLRQTCFSVLESAQTHREQSEAERKKRIAEIQKNAESADKMLCSLLTANGYPADYLTVKYHCEDCCDSGFINGKPCECLKREIAVVGAEKINEKTSLSLSSFDTFSLDYYRELPPDQFAAMQKILAQCKDYAAQFSSHAPSLLLIGQTGLGKTHLSLAIANVVLQNGFNVIYDTASALLSRIEAEKFAKSPELQTADTMGMLLDCDLLIFDDFGTEFDTAFTQSAIYSLFNGRLSAGKPMIINTNLGLMELQNRYGDRIVSRLISSCKTMQFYGSDIRIQNWKNQINHT